MPKMIIVRGLPGSGKSTVAKGFPYLHLEADMFLMNGGEYKWSGGRVSQAHSWCKNSVITAIQNKMDVVISNTFTQKWEFKDYLELAESNGYEVTVFRCTKNYGNTHGVPQEALDRMKERFEDFEGEVLI
jgi:predicted kinase